MWKYCPSIFAALAGMACVTPLFAVVCSPSAPKHGAKCIVAHQVTPEPTGECFLADGNCISFSCTGTEFGIAKGGACDPFDPTSESGLECIEDFEKKTLRLTQYAARCESAESCRCVWEDTGESKNEEVCNCKD
jgi:hypothetical protein